LTDDGVLVIEDLLEPNKNIIVDNFPEKLKKCTYYLPGKNKGVEDDGLIICDKSLL